jgi:uncharacterized protein
MSILPLAEQMNPWWRDPSERPLLEPRRRAMQRVLMERIVSEAKRATVLRGPRQVGKTTLLKQCIADLLDAGWPAANVTYFDFSDERFVAGSGSPREVAEHVPQGFSEDRPRVLLLDEITRAARWSQWLKQVVDARTHRVIATDSSASLLRDEGIESGAGRWDDLQIEGLTYREFLEIQMRDGEDKNDVVRRLPDAFERYLERGGFPEHVTEDSLSLVWSRLRDDISGKAIRKDLAAAHIDTERVNHVFQYLIEESGSIVDARKLASQIASSFDAAPDRRSLTKWLELLEGTMLIQRLDRRAHSSGSRLKARATPRYYACDHGLVMAFATVADPERDADVRSRAFEALAYRHLREVGRTSGTPIGFERDANGDDEIDFVLEASHGLVAIEVKHSRSPRSGDIDALRARARKIGATRAILLYGGVARLERDGVELVPMHEFALEPERWLSR